MAVICIAYKTLICNQVREAIMYIKKSLRQDHKQWGLEDRFHWNTDWFKVGISKGLVLEWSVVAIAITMIPTNLKLNHPKSKQRGCHFAPIFNGFRQNGSHFVQTEHH